MKSRLLKNEKSTAKWQALLMVPLFVLAATQAKAQYCSAGSSDCSYESITNVSFSNLTHTSTCGSGYDDVTSDTAEVEYGDTLTLSVTISPDMLEHITAWIDWNQNDDFTDSGEEYVIVSSVSTSGPHTVTVVVPDSATYGTTRMRISLDYDNTPTPCGTQSYGEVEDYRVRVGGCNMEVLTDSDSTSVYSANDGSASVSVSGGVPPYSYEWNTGDTTAVVTGLSAGTYTVIVTDNGECADTFDIDVEQPESYLDSDITGPDSVTGNTTVSYTVQVSDTSVTLNWDVQGGVIASGQGTDSVAIAWGGPGSGAVILESDTGSGAVQHDTLEVMIISGIGTEDLTFGDVAKMYPNPVRDILYLEFRDSEDHLLRIFDMQGKLLYEKESRNSAEISFGEFPAGMYFIRLDEKTAKIIKQ